MTTVLEMVFQLFVVVKKVCSGSVRNNVVINRFTCLPYSVIILLQRYKQCSYTLISRNANVLVNTYVKLHCIGFNSDSHHRMGGHVAIQF